MHRDRVVGIALLIASIAVTLIYGWLVFFTPWSVLVIQITAFILIAVLFGILAWVGYTLATTPPPKPIEEIEKEIEEELKKLESEVKSETKPQ